MEERLGEAKLENYGWWDRVRIFFSHGGIEEGDNGWTWTYYKVYKGRKIVIQQGRYH